MTLELEESRESGKTWPHGEREPRRHAEQQGLELRFTPPLSPAMRLKLAQLRDEAYAAGRIDGRAEMEREFAHNGLASLIIGAISATCVMGAAWHFLG